MFKKTTQLFGAYALRRVGEITLSYDLANVKKIDRLFTFFKMLLIERPNVLRFTPCADIGEIEPTSGLMPDVSDLEENVTQPT